MVRGGGAVRASRPPHIGPRGRPSFRPQRRGYACAGGTGVRLLHAEGLALIRGGRLLFESLDLHLDGGEALHVAGPNGSGKSSLIRLVAGLLTPSAGRIERAGAALADEGLALDRELPLGRALAFWRGPHLGEAMRAFALDE